MGTWTQSFCTLSENPVWNSLAMLQKLFEHHLQRVLECIQPVWSILVMCQKLYEIIVFGWFCLKPVWSLFEACLKPVCQVPHALVSQKTTMSIYIYMYLYLYIYIQIYIYINIYIYIWWRSGIDGSQTLKKWSSHWNVLFLLWNAVPILLRSGMDGSNTIKIFPVFPVSWEAGKQWKQGKHWKR